MLIYRIEHKESGLGPWFQSTKDGIWHSDNMNYCKEPEEMNPNIYIYGNFFGVNDSFLINRIIKNWRKLSKHNFHIVTYKCDPIYVYEDGQVLFDKKNATKINEDDIHDFLINERKNKYAN